MSKNGSTRFQVKFSLITALKPAILSKRFSLDADKLVKTPGGNLIRGICEIQCLDLAGFASLLETLKPSQALTFGAPEHHHSMITTQEALRKGETHPEFPVISRDRKHFSWPQEDENSVSVGGVMMLDYDPQRGVPPLTRDALLGVLHETLPALETTSHIWTCSASSCIYRTDTGEEIRGIMGQRIYIPVKDASDIPRAGKVLFDRLWLKGHGRFDVSKSGVLLDRTLIDSSVWQPERLDFAGGAACGPELEQRRPKPLIFNAEGEFLNTLQVLPDLTPEERGTLKSMKDEERFASGAEQNIARETWIENRLQALAAKNPKGFDLEKAQDMLRRAVMEKRLFGDFEIITEKHGVLTVGQILDMPEKYHGARCHDPLEPDYGGNDNRIGKINLRAVGKPYLWSFAHGGTRYALHRAIKTIRLEGGELQSITLKVLELIRLDGAIFERGGELVRLGVQE